jgi:hypothetical protein
LVVMPGLTRHPSSSAGVPLRGMDCGSSPQ